jgi:hypothetical protein
VIESINIKWMDKFTLNEAVELIGDGATYRTVNYYKGIYTSESDLIRLNNKTFVTRDFINKVIKNRQGAKKTISEPRTKSELLKEIESLQDQVQQNEKKYLKEIESLQDQVQQNEKAVREEDIIAMTKEVSNLKETIADYENSEVFEKASEGMRVELFSKNEYAVFEERLIQWRLQRQEIEQTKVHFASLKDEKDFIKGQLEYFKISNDKILQQHQNLIDGLRERNRIEATEKGVIPKEPRGI